MDATGRRQHILELLSRNEVHTQEQLLALLAAEGVRATQATVSRDLRELGIRKQPEGYSLPDTPSVGAARRHIGASVRRAVVAVERGPQLLVIRTEPGRARDVAQALNRSGLHEVVGAIAGEDVVFVAAQTAAHVRSLARLITSK